MPRGTHAAGRRPSLKRGGVSRPSQAGDEKAHTVRLVLGDQLNPRHSWFQSTDRGVVYVLLELRQETDYVRHHVQKVPAIFAAMSRFAAGLCDAGHRVVHRTLDGG